MPAFTDNCGYVGRRCKLNKMDLREYCDKILGLVNFSAQELIIPLMEPEKISTEPNKFSYSLLLKFNNGLESLNILLLNIRDKPQFSDSVCILLRTLLSDVITLEYILRNIEINEKELIKEIDNIYFDHIKYMYKNMHVFGKLNKADDREVNQNRKELIKEFPRFFNKDGGLSKDFNGLPALSKMIQDINEDAPMSIYKQFAKEAYNYYDIFSKYEHLGAMTFLFVHRAYDTSLIEHVISEAKSSIRIVLLYHHLLATQFYIRKSDKLRNYVDYLRQIEPELAEILKQ